MGRVDDAQTARTHGGFAADRNERIGDITAVQASDIQAYQGIISSNNISEIHFYAFQSGMSQANLDQLRALGTSTPLVA